MRAGNVLARWTRPRRRARALALAALVGVLGVAASLDQTGFALEEDIGLDALFRMRGARPAPDEAVIVRFDRDVFARLRGLPERAADWPEPLRGCARDGDGGGGLAGLAQSSGLDRLPRGFQACLVRELTRRGASVIAFDVAFRDDPARREGVPELARALREHGRAVLLEKAVRVRVARAADPARPPAAIQADLLEGPQAELAAAAIATAPFLLPRVGDRVHQFWAVNPALPIPTQLPARALEALAADALARFGRSVGGAAPPGLTPAQALRRDLERFDAELGRRGRLPDRLPGLSAPDLRRLEALARVRQGPAGYYLNFYGPPGSFASVSAADLLLPEPGRPPDGRFADLAGKVVFVGYAELHVPQANDSFPTAFSRDGIDLGGVEIAATGFANLLRGETLRAPPEWARLLLVGLLGFGLVLASCHGRVWRGLALTLALAGGYAGLAALAFVAGGLWLPTVVPLLLLLPLAVGLGQLVHYLGAARWLSIYTPREVGRQLLQGREPAPGQAERREVTVLLTDIVGFTTLAERSAPEAIAALVNRHFTTLTACVEAEAGSVGQFIGDGMMAYWGAPDPQRDHAARACRAALAIRAALAADNRAKAARGEPAVRIRIGVNTGAVTAGNIGAPGRSSYGIVGDAVNTTQRIEQLAKLVWPDEPTAAVLVSAGTRARAGGDDAFRFADAGVHLVRGRQEAVRIFRLEDAAAGADVAAGAAESPTVVRLPAPRAPRGGAPSDDAAA